MNKNVGLYVLLLNSPRSCFPRIMNTNGKTIMNSWSIKVIVIAIIQQSWLYQWHSGNAQNWKTGGARFKPRPRLSTYPFGVFRGFLRNLCKYGQGSLRNTLHGYPHTPPIGLGPSALKPRNSQPSLLLSVKNIISVRFTSFF